MLRPLTFAEMADHSSGLGVPEVVALVLAVAEECAGSATGSTWPTLPPAEHILLSDDGRISIFAEEETTDEREHVKMLAHLLKTLSGVDELDSTVAQAHLPEEFTTLIARASGASDLPAPSFADFTAALGHLGSTDELTLASLYRRHIREDPSVEEELPFEVELPLEEELALEEELPLEEELALEELALEEQRTLEKQLALEEQPSGDELGLAEHAQVEEQLASPAVFARLRRDRRATHDLDWRLDAQSLDLGSERAQALPAVVLALRPEPPSAPDPDWRIHAAQSLDTGSEADQATAVPFGRARAAAAAALALAALAASFMIGVKIIGPERQAGNTFNAPARPAPQATSAVAAPAQPSIGDPAIEDPVSISQPRVDSPASSTNRASAAPGARQHPNAPGISTGPVLTAAAIGTDVFSPSFIEQGRALLFHSGRAKSSLMRLSLDDPAHPSVTTVLQDGATNYHAAPSPDGKWLAYDSDRDQTRAVYVAPVGGHDAIKVSGDGYAAIPRWSPDGSKLAFIKAEPRRPRVWNVWVANPDGTGLTRVSDHSVGEAWSASWFPGGTRLAYSVEDRLVIADLTLGTSRVIRSPRPGHLVRTPAVSPDGKWIVFQVHRDGAWLLQVGTGRMHRVLGDTTAEEFAWSPDGSRVVYHTHRDGGWSLWQLAFGRSA